VPEMKRVCSAMQEVDFKDNSFEAITAIYSIFHLPLLDQSKMFKKFFRWLKSKGSILFTYATKEYTKSETFSGYMDFMGEKLFYSHKSPEELKSELSDLGFIIESFKYRDIGNETFLWVTAAKR
jgi:ubiquinone/menaquinone biosynthesis C-methylase UbiE